MNFSQPGIDRKSLNANAERDLVRELAKQVVELAAAPRMAEIHKRWCDVNALRKPDRAPVWCRPMGAWEELLPEESLACTDPWLRRLEREFRRALIKNEIGDDSPLENYYAVPAAFDVKPENIWGVETGQHRPSGPGGAWGYDPPLKTHADYSRLIMPRFTFNAAETRRQLERASELLGEIMPIRVTCSPRLAATLGTAAAELRGLEQMMMDMAMEPQLMHRLMAHLRDATLAALDSAEESGRLTPNNRGPMNKSDAIGEADKGAPVTAATLWCMANSQEFDQVSPDMWEEFCLAYQKPIFERYGLVGYGCCENLTRKIDGVLSIPNLRIFVCSAWTDLNVVLEKVSSDYCIMWRQKASDVVFPDDEAQIRSDLLEGARKLQGRPHQIVLRELQTLSGHPKRLHAWTRHAIEATEKYS